MKDRVELLYRQYGRIMTVPFITCLLFVVLVPLVVIPQIQLLLKTRQNLEEGKTRLVRLENKRSALRILDESALRGDFSLASAALPSGKDVGSILVTLDIASQKSGVALGNFSTAVGSLDEASDAAELPASPSLGGPASPKVGAPTLKMAISARGGRDNLRQFLQAVSEALPLVTVETISLSSNDATISLLFYYKPVITSLGPIDSDLPSLLKFRQTIASLSARRSKLAIQLPTSLPAEKTSTPSPQLFPRPNPFF